jgi:phosphoribosylformylglycinamidine (FGAM) synthase-like enzyme
MKKQKRKTESELPTWLIKARKKQSKVWNKLTKGRVWKTMNWKDKRIAEINKINKGGNAPDTEYGMEVYAIYDSEHESYEDFIQWYKPYIKQLEDSQTKSLKNIMEGLGWHEKV